MAVSFDLKTGIFKLSTKNTDYIFWAAGNQRVYHLYYGKKISDTSALIRQIPNFYPASFSPMPAESELTYSADWISQEYTGCNTGDFRMTSACIRQADGAMAADVRYDSHRIFKGKVQLKGLPSAFDAGDNEVESLELVLLDKAIQTTFTLTYTVFPSCDVIVRSVRVQNCSQETIYIKNLMSCQLDFQSNALDIVTLNGSYARERYAERNPLHRGIQAIRSVRGSSGHSDNPVMALCDKSTTEITGSAYGFILAYSGNFLVQAECDQFEGTRVLLGINPENFEWRLLPNEDFHTPETFLTYSSDGLNGMSSNFHDFMRKHWIRERWAMEKRPILINNWEATYFNFDDRKILSIAEKAKSLGIEMLVLDDGWFGKRNDDRSSLGDWFVNRDKLGDLPKLISDIHALGLKFGLWFEPEMISEDSDLYRAHPDWVLDIPNRPHTLGRHQMVLDMSRPEIVNYLFDCISQILHSAKIEYIKWDMNRNLTEIRSPALSADRQGETAHRYVLGVYRLHERLLQEFPDLLIEGCSGGGGRFDAGMLYYCPQIWCSDDTDAIERLNIQQGTSVFYPASSMGAHVSVCPNHGTGRTTPFETRGYAAFAGSSGYELDLTKLTEQESEIVRRQVQEFHEFHDIAARGSLYRLTDIFDHRANVVSWCFVSPDRKNVLLFAVRRQVFIHAPTPSVRLNGLCPDMKYEFTYCGKQTAMFGDTLMNAGLVLKDLGYTDGSGVFYAMKAKD